MSMFCGCADQAVLFPSTGFVDPEGATRKLLPFERGQLEILVARSPGAAWEPPSLYILSFCGNGGRAEMTAVPDALDWEKRAVEVWAVNYPGYGGSTGPATLRSMGPAGLAAFDALVHESHGRPIVVAGSSLGTTVALHVAANRPVVGAILRNPPPMRSLIMGEYGWWNLWAAAGVIAAQIPGDLDSIANGAQTRVPAIFMSSDRDEVVPVHYQRKVFEAYAGEKQLVVLKGAGHSSEPRGADVLANLATARQWLWERAVEPSAVSASRDEKTPR